MKINYLDLFSGIGGFSEGLRQAGFEFNWHGFSEIDKHAKKIYQKHFPSAEDLGDVRFLHSKSFLDNHVKTFYPSEGSDYSEEENIMAGKLKKLTIAQVEESIKMYEAGMSLAPIAAYFQISRNAMYDLLKRRIKLRPMRRSGKDNHFYRGGESADGQAQNVLEYAITKGIIPRKSHCENCGDHGTFKNGRTKIQAHHCDYNKPLDVIWLCKKCHHDWHKKNKAKRKESLKESHAVDLITAGFP